LAGSRYVNSEDGICQSFGCRIWVR
jgi:hypothetical protein